MSNRVAQSTLPILIRAVILLLLVATGFLSYKAVQIYRAKAALEVQVSELGQSLQLLNGQLTRARSENADLAATNDELHRGLTAERQRNDNLASEVGTIASKVGTLEKLKNTDPELLKKYSKVYFLNENYVPKRLTDIPTQYLYDTEKPQQILTDVWPRLQALLDAALAADKVTLQIFSAYRSFGTQASVKSNYRMIYGSGANQFSADQGYSEHQLGTTVDFTTTGAEAGMLALEKTPAYNWLAANAYRYGFILSYPRGNSYYQFEPWHWRYVGVELATRLHDDNKNFYDASQRFIDIYLVKIFD